MFRRLLAARSHAPARWSLGRRLGAVALVVIGASGVVTAAVVLPEPDPVAVTPITEAPDQSTAMAAALRQGSRVEVLDVRTETRSIFADPDGTMTAEVSLVPQRVRKNGRWVAPDTTVVRDGDVIRPQASIADVTFSPGGSKRPLVRLGMGDKTVELSWPRPLPMATIDGNTVTYADVLPGVDLRMIAQIDGYRQHLVVKTREAAANPELARIQFKTRTTGVELRDADVAGLHAYDSAGEMVFAAPTALMWDSAERPESDDPFAGKAIVDVQLGPDVLALVPDQTMLASPATVFPVTIDPDMSTVEKNGWTTVYDDGSETMRLGTHWNGANSQSETKSWVPSPSARVGRAYETTPTLITRSYFQFDTRFVGDRDVLSAQVKAAVAYGPACDWKHWHDLHVAHKDIEGATNWNTQPTHNYVGNALVPTEYSTCLGRKHVGFDTQASIDKYGYSTFVIRSGGDEQDQNAWRKYDPAHSKLEVKFNTKPIAPTGMYTNPPMDACHLCGITPYVGGSTVSLGATVSDPDGDQVTPQWDLYFNDVGPTRIYDSPKQNSGTATATSVSLSGRDGHKVTWYVRAKDSVDAIGPWSAGKPTTFYVDTTAPSKKPIVKSNLYPMDNSWHGGPGVEGSFTFQADGVSDVIGYQYGWQQAPDKAAFATALGGDVTVQLIPPGDGPRTLFVRSIDRANNPSDWAHHHFYVRPGNGPAAQYAFEGNAKDTAHLGSRDGTVVGAHTYQQAAVGSGVELTGGAHVQASNTLRTDESFTVSAWVRLNEFTAEPQAIVSQSGQTMPGFALWYRPKDKYQPALGGNWEFGGGFADNQAAGNSITASTPVQTRTWTHVTGVYDKASKSIKLYVNGDLAAKQTLPETFVPWHAPGGVLVGRMQWDSQFGNPLNGAVDEVSLYERALTDNEIKAAVMRDNVTVGRWRFDENQAPQGSTAALKASNDVGGGDPLTFVGDAAFSVDAAVGESAIRLDGAGDAASTVEPQVRTDSNYTVSAWVKLNSLPTGNNTQAVLSQAGDTTSSGFILGVRGNPRGSAWAPEWTFVTTKSATDPTSSVFAHHSDPQYTVPTATWTHIAAVHNTTADPPTATLYVGGKPVHTASITTSPWNAAGPLSVGRARWGVDWVDHLNGSVDDVRVYSRALGAAEIAGVVAGDNVRLAAWNFDGDGKDEVGTRTATMLDSNVNPVVVDWTAGQSSVPSHGDLAVRLDAGNHATASNVVNTSVNFSVAAWAKLDRVGGYPTVVSQDGANVSAFQLQAAPDGNTARWAFTMFDDDVAGGGAVHNRVTGPIVQLNTWTHLVGVYDSDADVIQLYANGVLAGTAPRTDSWNHATGAFAIGRAKWNGARANYFPGAIDDVAVYSRALFADEIRIMAGRDSALVHHLTFDEPSGTVAGDSMGARSATFTGDVTHLPGRVGNAVGFDGVSAVATTGGVDLRGDQSFTVSGWVRTPKPTTAEECASSICYWTAVSQDGDVKSKFRLGLVINGQNPGGRWTFEVPEASGENEVTGASVSTQPADFDAWVHLVGTYDVQSGKTRIWVNSVREGDGTLLQPWHSNGGLVIGRGKFNGQVEEFWPGQVDDVRLYTGVMGKSKVEALYASYPAAQDSGPVQRPEPNAGWWKLDEPAPKADVPPVTKVVDTSGRGKDATLVGDATPRDWFLETTSTGFAQTATPVIETSQSFSVAGWAYMDTNTTMNRTVFAQDGSCASSFLVQYRADIGKWVVIVPTEDKDNPAAVLLASSEAAAIGDWQHLAVSYDAGTHQLRLYVNGVLSAARTGVTVPDVDGPFTLGRGKWDGKNTDFFRYGIDEVWAFSRTITAGEVRWLHDNRVAAPHGTYLFDDNTVRDTSGRENDATLVGGSYVAGVSGNALKLNGTTGVATASALGVPMRDSFTVSAWAKLDADDRDQTVLAQDGYQMSGFELQYRKSVGRWVFGGAVEDVDSSTFVYALDSKPAVVGRWVHLAGVYDQAARQLRFYVDGALVGMRADVRLFNAGGKLTIGRGKVNGSAANHFNGVIDDVFVAKWMASAEEIAAYASYPTPPPGQLGRFVNTTTGARYSASTDLAIRPGYRFERSLGVTVASGVNTRKLYSCQSGDDVFTSIDQACAGSTVVGEAGHVYTVKPTNLPTLALYECRSATDGFESLESACDGATQKSVLGYVQAYGRLARYISTIKNEHVTTAFSTPPGYRYEGEQGWLAKTASTGTTPLVSCRDGVDRFLSVDAACDGKTVLGSTGHIWTSAPAGMASVALYQCVYAGQRFTNLGSCEGHALDRQLGFVLTSLPATAAVFS